MLFPAIDAFAIRLESPEPGDSRAVRLVLWDIDGTLVRTGPHGREAFGTAFTAVFGREVDVSDLPMAGRTDHAITMALLEEQGIDDRESHLDRVFAELTAALEARREAIAAEGRALPGARAALEVLGRRDDVTQSLLTGNLEVNAALKLSAFGLAELVDLEIGGYGSDPHTTRSDLVGAARGKAARLRGLHVEASDTVLIGDTPLDVEAAHTAGARAVAVATGPYSVDELQETGAHAVLEDLSDLSALMAALGGR